MATVKLGSVVSDIRGSIGDETYGRNQGGIFVRARVDPAQPSSTARDATQAAMTALSQAWSGSLSDAQRSTWRTYAQAFTLPDRFGRPKTLSPICHFIRSNAQRYRTDSTITAEIAPAQPPLPMPSFGFTAKAAGALVASGVTVPPTAGTYTLRAPVNHRPAWEHVPLSRYLWQNATVTSWYISSTPGVLGSAYWYNTTAPNGVYTPAGTATGTPALAYSAAQSSLTITLPPYNYPDLQDGLRLFAYAGSQVTTGRNYYSTPFRFVGANHWSGSAWDLDPWTVPHYDVLTTPGRVFLRMVAVASDGATSVRGQARSDIEA